MTLVSADLLIQGLGWAATALAVISMTTEVDARLRILNLMSLILWFGHNALMGSDTAAFMCALAFVMIMARMLDAQTSLRLLLVLNVLLLAPALMATDPLTAALPVAAGLLINFGVSALSGIPMRIFCVFGFSLWAGFGHIVNSAPIIAANGLAGVAALFGIVTILFWEARRTKAA